MATSRMPVRGFVVSRLWATSVLLIAAVVGAVLLARNSTGRSQPDERPDIVLVVWDTCRADRLSAFDHPRLTTPLLDELAADGARFTRCMAPAPITAPSHGSLFTGMYPWRHGLLTGRDDRLHVDLPTLAERLRDSGYETVGFTGNAFLSSVTGLSRGFETFVPYWRGETGNKEGSFALAAVDGWLKERAARGESDSPRRPLFLFINMMDTHLPLRPEEGDVEAVRPPGVSTRAIARAVEMDAPHAMAHILGVQRWDDEVLAGLGARYDGAVHALDRWTGRIFGRLRLAGLLDDSVQVVVGDHGEALGEHGMLDHRMNLHDPVMRVPLVLRWPGRFDGGVTVEHPVSVLDVHATLLEAAGLGSDGPDGGRGMDAVPLSTEPIPGRVVLAHSAPTPEYLPDIRIAFPHLPEEALTLFRTSIDVAVGEGPDGSIWKYLIHTRHDELDHPVAQHEVLFDLDRDPGETRNLLDSASPQHRAMADSLREALREAGR